MTSFQVQRQRWAPPIPKMLQHPAQVSFQKRGDKVQVDSLVVPYFPHSFSKGTSLHRYSVQKGEASVRTLKIGALFSGGPAPGGHNVLMGMQQILGEGTLIGFLGGPSGLIEGRFRTLHREEVLSYRNTGGFDLLGSGRTKIATEQQLAAVHQRCMELELDGLVIIGGDDSNTNGAMLAEYFLAQGCTTGVIGLPKTIDGDLQAEHVPISFGFDTACKTYCEMIGNIGRDAISSRKYYHFIKLMGRSASHIALECALATQPNCAFVGEEKRSLVEIVEGIASLIERRYRKKKEYGVLLIPEGLIEFIPEMDKMMRTLNQFSGREATEKLTGQEKAVFDRLPHKIQEQLLLDRDSHGNIPLSQIDTQGLLIELVTQELKSRGTSVPFSSQAHFLGYEGRAAFPSNFDACYCLSLGMAAVLAVRDGLTGVLCGIPNLHDEVSEWQVEAMPLLALMALENRKGVNKPVIAKTLVDLNGKAFTRFARFRKSWEEEDCYLYPGPIQFFGSQELCDRGPSIIYLN